jgi:DNA-binding response OmpR family regulator
VKNRRVLVIDDEKNIRLTIAQSLEKLGLEVDGAVNGEEALQKIHQQVYQLILLDLKLPGMDGMEVLRQVRASHKKIKFLIITAHGTIDNAVEAMKLGAVDFIQKPFTPDEIRAFVTKALARAEGFLDRLRQEHSEAVDELVESLLAGKPAGAASLPAKKARDRGLDYAGCIEQAKAAVEAYDFESASAWAEQAVALDTSRAEAYNLLGALRERRGDRLGAQRYYRAALAIDPTYQPAWNNLNRSSQFWPEGRVDLGEGPEKKGSSAARPAKKRKTR